TKMDFIAVTLFTRGGARRQGAFLNPSPGTETRFRRYCGFRAMEPIEEHIQDETDAEYLYRTLAAIERDPAQRASFERLAQIEGAHRGRWIEHARQNGGGGALDAIGPSFRARALGWLAKRLGSRFLVPLLRAEEAREVAAYLEIAERSRSESERAT